MKTVVIVCQHENWEDDAGSHDPYVVRIDEKLFDRLATIKGPVPFDEFEELEELLLNSVIRNPVYPIQLDGVFNIWYSYD